MPVPNPETREPAPDPTVADRIVDAVRHAAHLFHEARLVKSIAKDAGEDGVHAVKRAIKRVQRGVETLGDLKDEAAHSVKAQPLTAIGRAAGVGFLVGVAVGWTGGRVRQRQPDTC